MNNVSVRKQISRRLPKLAALAAIVWGMSSSAHLDAAPAWMIDADLPAQVAHKDKSWTEDDQPRVLSEKDAALYRAAFAAQDKADWGFADKSLAKVSDKDLIGHVLADRYLSRTPTLDEAKAWLTSYAALPEAKAIFSEAKKLKGFSTSSMEEPKNAALWQGNNGISSFSSIPNANDGDNASIGTSLKSDINYALRRGDPFNARSILLSALNRGSLSITNAGDFISRIAAAFYYLGEIENARPMARYAALSNNPLGLWIDGLASWKQKDYGTAAHSFAALAEIKGLSSWNRAAAYYWAYRASSRLGDKSQAYRYLANAAKYPYSFYGAMASGLMGHPVEYSWKMPELDAESFALLASQPSGRRALALTEIGRNDLAETELRQLLSSGSHPMQAAALALAEKARMPSLTLQLSSVTFRENGKPFDAALYPLPPWQPSDGFKVDRALVYAIMRHESQFDPDAVSKRGACGLMQIMPSTARHILNNAMRFTHAKSRCADSLLDPETNVDMGQKYIQMLADTPMIRDNLLFLLAAYNAGPGNLARWIGDADRSDPLLFIESMPVRETRDYVQQVLLHYWMYSARLSNSGNSASALARGEWPKYSLRDDNDEAPARRADFVLEGVELASLTPTPIVMSGLQ